MSGFGSDLYRFGLDPDKEPDREQWANLCRVIRALVNNPNLKIGTENSEIVIPHRPGGALARAADVVEPRLVIIEGTATGLYQVTNGTVNSVTPTLATVLLSAAPAPEFTVTADAWVWLKCVGTFGTPDTFVVTVQIEATAGVPAGTAITGTGFTSFFYIGRVDFTAGAPATYNIINQHGGGNLGVDSWGLYNLWWRA